MSYNKINGHHVLLIGDKWHYRNNQKFPNDYVNDIYLTLSEFKEISSVDLFSFDNTIASSLALNEKIFFKRIKKKKPDSIVLINTKIPNSDLKVITYKCLDFIKKLKIPIIAIWSDLQNSDQKYLAQLLKTYTTLNIFTSSSAIFNQVDLGTSHAFMCVPKSSVSLNNNKFQERHFDVTYLGSPKKERIPFIKYLQKEGINLFCGGGERLPQMNINEYISILQNSKICISFSYFNGVVPVINARTFEVIASGSMLLEQAGPETAKLFKPGQEYEIFFTKKELLEKIKYYLNNQHEIIKITSAAKKKYIEYYSADRFWKIAFRKLFRYKHLKITNSSNKFNLATASELEISQNWGFKNIKLDWVNLEKIKFSDALLIKIVDVFNCNRWLSPMLYSYLKIVRLFNRLIY